MTETILDVAVIVSNHFERVRVPYVIGGSVASTIHGEPRFTRDVDFAAAMRSEHVQPFVKELLGPFHFDVTDVRQAVAETRLFCVTHVRTGAKVDIHVRAAVGFHASEFARAQRVRLRSDMETRVRVASAEDTVIQKLVWYRLGGEHSDRQWRDVRGVLRARAEELDVAYLQRWALDLGVPDLLQRALIEAEVSPPSTE